MKTLAGLLQLVVWIAGIVIAKGFWSTFFAVIMPLWSWYLVIEAVLVKYNFI